MSGLFFFYFVFATLLIVNECLLKICRWHDLNCGTLSLEATALPVESQPLPKSQFLILAWTALLNCSLAVKMHLGIFLNFF